MFCYTIVKYLFEKKFFSEQIINEVDIDMAIETTRRPAKCFLKLELKEKDISVVKTNRKVKFKFFSIEDTRSLGGHRGFRIAPSQASFFLSFFHLKVTRISTSQLSLSVIYISEVGPLGRKTHLHFDLVT